MVMCFGLGHFWQYLRPRDDLDLFFPSASGKSQSVSQVSG